MKFSPMALPKREGGERAEGGASGSAYAAGSRG